MSWNFFPGNLLEFLLVIFLVWETIRITGIKNVNHRLIALLRVIVFLLGFGLVMQTWWQSQVLSFVGMMILVVLSFFSDEEILRKLKRNKPKG